MYKLHLLRLIIFFNGLTSSGQDADYFDIGAKIKKSPLISLLIRVDFVVLFLKLLHPFFDVKQEIDKTSLYALRTLSFTAIKII